MRQPLSSSRLSGRAFAVAMERGVGIAVLSASGQRYVTLADPDHQPGAYLVVARWLPTLPEDLQVLGDLVSGATEETSAEKIVATAHLLSSYAQKGEAFDLGTMVSTFEAGSASVTG